MKKMLDKKKNLILQIDIMNLNKVINKMFYLKKNNKKTKKTKNKQIF